MRVIKNKNIKYESFLKTIMPVQKETPAYFSDHNFVKEIFNCESIEACTKLLAADLKRYLDAEEIALFNYSKEEKCYLELEKCSDKIRNFVKRSLSEGILEWVEESGVPVIIPDSEVKQSAGLKRKYILFVPKEKHVKKLVVILVKRYQQEQTFLKSIENSLRIFLLQCDRIVSEKSARGLLSEMNLYHSKMSNDFKYSAIGELTSGIVEEILSPLQIIMSYTDILQKEKNISETGIPQRISKQVLKVEQLVSRLVKFAGVNNEKIDLEPCNLSQAFQEYYTVVKSSLEQQKIEVVLDLDDSIPLITSNRVLLNQLFTNLLTIVKKGEESDGGLLVQTRLQSSHIILKLLYTGTVRVSNVTQLPELSILENLMKKHEGKMIFESENNIGTTICLSFPLIRKIRS